MEGKRRRELDWGGREPWRPEKQAENKQIEGERREKQAKREGEARRAGGKLSMRGDSDRQTEEINGEK